MEGIGHSEAGTTSQKQNKRVRLGILGSHPIQYQAPLFRRLAARRDIDVEVLFCSRWGLRSYLDPQFGVRFSWDVPVLEGYRSRFLMNLSPRRGPNGFFGVINPGVALPMLQKRFDALLLHGWALATNWIALAAAKAVRVPLLLRGESTGFDEPEGVKGAMRRVVLRQMFSGVSAFLAIGTRNARFYRDYDVSSERIFSAPYAVDNSFFSEQAKRLKGSTYRLRQREGIAVDRPLILFAGKLIQKKRPKDLLDAFDRVRTSIAVSLAFVGEGALRPELQRLARDKGIENVHFLGFRNQSEIGKCYAMADVLVLPS